jgi:hypothetical protein
MFINTGQYYDRQAYWDGGKSTWNHESTSKNRVEIFKEAVRKTHTDPEFIAEYRKLTGGDELTPLMPDEQAKIVEKIPRDLETIELFKTFAGTGPLPSL